MTDGRYRPRSPDDVRRLLLDHPLAWLVTAVGGDFHATTLPLRPVFDAAGEVEALIGHFARSNPHLQAVAEVPRALALFLGPHGYVSPSWLTDRTQAPTWTYASARFLVDVTLTDDEASLDRLMRDLVGAMEADRPDAWRIEEMGPRYRRLSRGVVGFRAAVLDRRPRFKLGQDERPDVFPEILEGLGRDGREDLRRWMADFGGPNGREG